MEKRTYSITMTDLLTGRLNHLGRVAEKAGGKITEILRSANPVVTVEIAEANREAFEAVLEDVGYVITYRSRA